MSSSADFVLGWIKSENANLYTELPGKVTKVYVKDGSTVINAKPMVNRVDPANGVFEEPELLDIPIQWPSGGGCFITCPIAVGDPVTLHFYMRNASSWKRGSGATPETPPTIRSHNLNDVYATPGPHPYRVGIEIDSEAATVSSGATEIRVLKDGTIEFGEGAIEKVILGSSFQTWINTLITTKIGLHTHISAAPGEIVSTPVDSGKVPITFDTMPDTTLSEVVKTK